MSLSVYLSHSSSGIWTGFSGILQGSDIPEDQLGRTAGAIVHRRAGVPVAVRVDAVQGRVWTIQFQGDASDMQSLRGFFLARSIYLSVPIDDVVSAIVYVLWSDDQFRPQVWAYNGTEEIYRVTAPFEEIV